MSTTRRLTVAVTGLNARADNPGPGLAVVRCLRESGDFDLRIVGLSYDALDPGLYHPRCDAAYLLGYPSAGIESLAQRLQEIHQREHLDALIPCLDAELPNLVRLEADLQSWGIRTFLPTPTQLLMRDKSRLAELAQIADVLVPETRLINAPDFFNVCRREGWDYPFVVKGLYYDAQICHDAISAAEAFRRIAASWGLPIIVQRVIRGEEYNLSGIGDGDGRLIGAVMMKKRAVTEKNKAWAGVTVFDQKLLDAANKLVARLQWRGPLEVELIRDATGHYHLVEINPRFPAWIYLGAGVGRNLPAALLKLMAGAPLPPFPQVPVGTLFIRYAEDVIVPLEAFESMMISGGHSARIDSTEEIST